MYKDNVQKTDSGLHNIYINQNNPDFFIYWLVQYNFLLFYFLLSQPFGCLLSCLHRKSVVFWNTGPWSDYVCTSLLLLVSRLFVFWPVFSWPVRWTLFWNLKYSWWCLLINGFHKLLISYGFGEVHWKDTDLAHSWRESKIQKHIGAGSYCSGSACSHRARFYFPKHNWQLKKVGR